MVTRTWKEKESKELAVLKDVMSFGPKTQQARGVLARREAGDSYPDITLLPPRVFLLVFSLDKCT